ncbi:MAG: hypothetical protein R3D30_05785 [Hyphomicrobiales bacterium]
MPEGELTPEPQLASLTPAGTATLPPGVIFSIEEPAAETSAQGIAVPSPEAAAAPATAEMRRPALDRWLCARPQHMATRRRNTSSPSTTPKVKAPRPT